MANSEDLRVIGHLRDLDRTIRKTPNTAEGPAHPAALGHQRIGKWLHFKTDVRTQLVNQAEQSAIFAPEWGLVWCPRRREYFRPRGLDFAPGTASNGAGSWMNSYTDPRLNEHRVTRA